MMHIEPLRPEDWTTAMNLALARVPEGERPTQVKHCVNLLAHGQLDDEAIRIARDESGAVVGVQVCVPIAGASCLFWLPTAANDLAELLIEACLNACRQGGTKIAQAFVTTEEMPLAQPFLHQGFQHITCMDHLRHELIELPPLKADSLRYETFRDVSWQDFARTLQRTYEGTLDCPELNGQRTMEEIVAGHQAEGKFDPDQWWLAYQGEQAVGVLMLVELQDGLTWDLTYLGIVPESRRGGHGRALLQHGLQFARTQMATQLILAVDGRNRPARRLYQSMGFVVVESYEVLLKFLGG